MNTITVQLRHAYRDSGLTLKQIACRAGVHENTVIGIIRGRGNPRVSTLIALCAVLGVTSVTLPSPDSHERTTSCGA